MELDFSFCIVTDNSNEACKRISQIVSSIRKLEIPNYEILAIGGEQNKFSGDLSDFRKINFDESVVSGWITKKKNDIVKLCKYDNLVIFHDYFLFHKNYLGQMNRTFFFLREHKLIQQLVDFLKLIQHLL